MIILNLEMLFQTNNRKVAGYVRNFVFGVEDSLVSTVGLLAGITAASVDQKTIIVSGVVLIFVEAFSMAIGTSLSEQTAEEYRARESLALTRQFKNGLIMFFSYFFAGFIPLGPYLFLNTPTAFRTRQTFVCGSPADKTEFLAG